MAIQIEKTEVAQGLENQKILLYGRAKVGKTTFANEFPNPIFFATESGHSHLKCDKINCTNWAKFLEACALIAGGKHEYKTVIVDTIDNLVDFCSEYVCKENGISHPADLAMGKGWSLVTAELKRAMVKLSELPYVIVMISHSSKETIETATGKKYDRWDISVSGKNRNVFNNMSDMILFIDFKKNSSGEMERIIRTKPCASWEAGDRSGTLPSELQLDYPTFYKALGGK